MKSGTSGSFHELYSASGLNCCDSAPRQALKAEVTGRNEVFGIHLLLIF
jgi:hypothetical protein